MSQSVVDVKSKLPKKKHWVYYPTRDMRSETLQWVDTMNIFRKKDYAVVDGFTKNGFRKVGEDDILYIHCHGLAPSGKGKTEQALWIEDKETYSPAKFAEFLINNGLSKQHKILKIAACYSDEFAKNLYGILQKDFPNISVYGYKKEMAVCQGNNNGKLAGLEPPLIIRDGKHTRVIPTEIEKEGVKEKYRARNQRVVLGIEAKISSEVRIANLEKEKSILKSKDKTIARALEATASLARSSPKKVQEHKLKQEKTNIRNELNKVDQQINREVQNQSSSLPQIVNNAPKVSSPEVLEREKERLKANEQAINAELEHRKILARSSPKKIEEPKIKQEKTNIGKQLDKIQGQLQALKQTQTSLPDVPQANVPIKMLTRFQSRQAQSKMPNINKNAPVATQNPSSKPVPPSEKSKGPKKRY